MSVGTGGFLRGFNIFHYTMLYRVCAVRNGLLWPVLYAASACSLGLVNKFLIHKFQYNSFIELAIIIRLVCILWVYLNSDTDQIIAALYDTRRTFQSWGSLRLAWNHLITLTKAVSNNSHVEQNAIKAADPCDGIRTFSASAGPRKSKVISSLVLVSILRALESVTSFWAMGATSVPIYLVLRRSNTLFVLISEILLLRKRFRKEIIMAVIIITAGTIISGFGDHAFLLSGYTLALVQNLLTTATNVGVCLSDNDGRSFYIILFIQNIISLPILIGCLILKILIHYNANSTVLYQDTFDDRCSSIGTSIYAHLQTDTSSSILSPCHKTGDEFLFYFLTASNVILSCLHQITSFLSITVSSPITTSVAGNCKDLLQTLIGGHIFDDFRLSVTNGIGITLSFLGCCIYAIVRLFPLHTGNDARIKEE